jgi:hypothetical protein
MELLSHAPDHLEQQTSYSRRLLKIIESVKHFKLGRETYIWIFWQLSEHVSEELSWIFLLKETRIIDIELGSGLAYFAHKEGEALGSKVDDVLLKAAAE